MDAGDNGVNAVNWGSASLGAIYFCTLENVPQKRNCLHCIKQIFIVKSDTPVDVGAFAIAGNLHCRSALSLMKQPLLPQRHKKKETHDTRREKVENGNCNCVFDPANGVEFFSLRTFSS
ncbi:hypothetical protein V1478_008805 [Vespula squamosa]|uniref:Uncharacterized protein n=1 Tax=Vespula squamosa TaxID=30214 RepID=A0ABD2AUJ2_VESSQ